jgi:iron complex outermembrane receptor protein
VLYGATPPGGIVNYTSRRPQPDFHAEVQGVLGTFDNRQAAGDVTGPLTDSLSYRLTGLYRKSDTQVNGAHVERTYIAPALKWDIGQATSLTLLAFYQRDDNHGGDGGFLPAQGTLLPNPNGSIPVETNVGEPGYNRFKRDLFGVGYEASHAFNEHIRLVQDLKYSRQEIQFFSIYGTGLQSDLRTLNRANFIFPEDIRNLGVDTRLEVAGSTGPIEHEALLALDYLETKNHTSFEFGSAPSIDIFHPVYGQAIPAPFFVLPDYIKSRSEQLGVYAQDTLKYEDWRLTLNARQDHLSGAVNDDKFTWRAGLNYVTSFGLAPYFAYSTSFQPVSGADFAGNAFVPTTGEQYELGVKYEPRPITRDLRWFASAAAYDLVQQQVLTNDPAHQFFSVQTGEVEVKGVELESVARIRERLSINASYSYTDSKVTKSNGADLGKQLPATPRSKAALLVDYTAQEGVLAGFGGGAGVRYLGAAYGDPANTLKSSAETLVDLLLHYDLGGLRPGLKGWRLSLNANNLFDKVYVQSCSDLNTCFYSQRRSVLFTLDRKW